MPRTKRKVVRWCFLGLVLGLVCLCWLIVVWQHQYLQLDSKSALLPSPLLSPSEHPPSKQSADASHHHERTPKEVHLKSKMARQVGTFNGLPVHKNSGSLQSFVQCSPHADIYGNKTWTYRSCAFTNLCFDTSSGHYVIFYDDASAKSSPQQQESDVTASKLTVQPSHATSLSMALGGINPRWDMGRGFDRGSWKVEWFPEVRKSSTLQSYYQLEDSVVWFPFYSFAGHNVGHLLWDDFYPLWRLAHWFGYHDPTRWLLIRHVLDQILYASCDIRRNKRAQCKGNFAKFLPLLGVSPSTFTSSRLVQLATDAKNSDSQRSTSLVCAKHGVAGLGMLTDHGNHDHGWQEASSWVPHNLGKGRQFYDFSQFALGNIRSAYGINQPTAKKSIPKISFSLLSSRDWDRRLDFAQQVGSLRMALSEEQAQVSTYTFWNMTVQEQLQVALSTNIFVSTCGGASMTASFMPRGSSLVIFYNSQGGWDFETLANNGQPARLDWDLLNNAAHLRVHWLPISTMNNEDDLELFVQLIRHELHIISNR